MVGCHLLLKFAGLRFRDLVDLASFAAADVAVLTGDIVNFPQQETISWVVRTLNSSLRAPGPNSSSCAIVLFCLL